VLTENDGAKEPGTKIHSDFGINYFKVEDLAALLSQWDPSGPYEGSSE